MQIVITIDGELTAIDEELYKTIKTNKNDKQTIKNNIYQSCIHKTVCKFNTVCRTNTDDKCSAYEPENICYLCSKSNSCEVKDYPVSKCKQHYYGKKHRVIGD